MQDQLIVALDFPTEAKAKETVLALGETVGYYKVGLELFLNSGGRIIEFLQEKRKKIFLDLKFHDIPNTTAQAARWAASLGIDMFNVHASGGSEMMKKAVEIIAGRAETECSGNVTKERLKEIAEIGVDYVSSGALTYGAPLLDLSLKNLHTI